MVACDHAGGKTGCTGSREFPKEFSRMIFDYGDFLPYMLTCEPKLHVRVNFTVLAISRIFILFNFFM